MSLKKKDVIRGPSHCWLRVCRVAGDSPDQKREKTRKMAAQTLQDLYKLQPNAQADIQKSAGYAVFNNLGTMPHPRIAAEELAN